MIVLGIDPGLSGAIAALDKHGNVEVHDMPTLALTRNGKNKREVDPHALYALISRLVIGVDRHAFVEQVGAMPNQGVSSVFSFGKSYGILIGVLASLSIPMTFVSPQRWKKALGVTAAKDGARARASQLMPSSAGNWHRVRDDGRAESALIGHYGLQVLGKGVV